jgi:hypothetical protein
MRTSARRIIAGVCTTTAIAVGGLVGAQAAQADWSSQYNATYNQAVYNCQSRDWQFGHGGCLYVNYITSGDYTGAAGNRYFIWHIHFTNHTCPAEYHISASDHIFYADWAGPCF